MKKASASVSTNSSVFFSETYGPPTIINESGQNFLTSASSGPKILRLADIARKPIKSGFSFLIISINSSSLLYSIPKSINLISKVFKNRFRYVARDIIPIGNP